MDENIEREAGKNRVRLNTENYSHFKALKIDQPI